MRADLAPYTRPRPGADRPPTERQAEVLDLIAASIRDRGFPPTLRDLARDMAFASTKGADDHVQALVRKGLLTRRSRLARGLALTKSGKAFIAARPGARRRDDEPKPEKGRGPDDASNG